MAGTGRPHSQDCRHPGHQGFAGPSSVGHRPNAGYRQGLPRYQAGSARPYAGPVPEEEPRIEPLDPPMVPFAVAGIVTWAVVGLVLLMFFRDWLADRDHENWLWTCLAGFLVGFPGLAVMLRHDANRRRRRRRRHIR